jgi:hypothetical protein
MRPARFLLAALAAVLVTAPAADASVAVATGVQRASLRVDTHGNAEVAWSARGVRRTVLVPARGSLLPGGRLSGRDVSRAAAGVAIPFARTVRRTPDGRLWALQAWPVARGGPLELRFSRWRGTPTEMTLAARPTGATELLEGQATFQGRPVTGYWRTAAGTPIRLAAALDCFACFGNAAGWTRFTSVRTRPDGSFAATVPLSGRGPRYRATIVGPNIGATLAPDASATAETSL